MGEEQSTSGLFDVQVAARLLSLQLLLPSLGTLISLWQQSFPGTGWGPGSVGWGAGGSVSSG